MFFNCVQSNSESKHKKINNTEFSLSTHKQLFLKDHATPVTQVLFVNLNKETKHTNLIEMLQKRKLII